MLTWALVWLVSKSAVTVPGALLIISMFGDVLMVLGVAIMIKEIFARH